MMLRGDILDRDELSVKRSSHNSSVLQQVSTFSSNGGAHRPGDATKFRDVATSRPSSQPSSLQPQHGRVAPPRAAAVSSAPMRDAGVPSSTARMHTRVTKALADLRNLSQRLRTVSRRVESSAPAEHSDLRAVTREHDEIVAVLSTEVSMLFRSVEMREDGSEVGVCSPRAACVGMSHCSPLPHRSQPSTT